MCHTSTGHHSLRGRAAFINRCAADMFALDQRRTHSCFSAGLAQRCSTLARADNDGFILIACSHGTLLSMSSILFERDAHSKPTEPNCGLKGVEFATR